jgi:hypothetical protein
MSFFSGIGDECDRIHLGGYPAPFREPLGLHVEEVWPLPRDSSVGLALTEGPAGTGTFWSERINLEGAQPLAGRPAVTRHAYGDGVAYYLGTRPDPATMVTLLRRTAAVPRCCPAFPGSRPPRGARRTRPGRATLDATAADAGEEVLHAFLEAEAGMPPVAKRDRRHGTTRYNVGQPHRQRVLPPRTQTRRGLCAGQHQDHANITFFDAVSGTWRGASAS